jgi:hypothetical protein
MYFWIRVYPCMCDAFITVRGRYVPLAWTKLETESTLGVL